MAQNKELKEQLECLTPKFRVSFPALFEAKAFKNQEPKFSVQMLFDKSADLSALKNAVKIAIVDKWGDKPPKGIKLPFKDGNEKDLEGYENMVVVTASSKYKPQVIDQKKNELFTEDDLYAGCFARAFIAAFAWEYKEGNTVMSRGVSFNLTAVQKLADGPKFTSRKNASDLFDAVEDGSTDASNFASDDDFLN